MVNYCGIIVGVSGNDNIIVKIADHSYASDA